MALELARQSGLMLAAQITFPHFSVALGLRTVQLGANTVG